MPLCPVTGESPNPQPALPALLFDPAEAMCDGTRRFRLVAGSHPGIALVVRISPIRRLIGQQKCRTGPGIADKIIEHHLNLLFGGVCPDGVGKEEIESFVKHRSVEIGIAVKAGTLALQNLRFQDLVHAECQPLLMRFNTAVAAGVEKVDEPITGAQHSAADVEHSRVRIESGPQQVHELLTAGELKVFSRNAVKAVLCQRLKFLLQIHTTR